MKSRTGKLTELAILTALAFIFSYVESLFPLPIPFPGIKLGLANLIIVLVLYREGFPDAFLVSMIRNLLNAFTFGSLFSFFYSLAGSILSLASMAILKKSAAESRALPKRLRLSPLGVSVTGGILHNIGQFIVAACLVGPAAILPYLPFLYFAGLVAGALIGTFTILCLRRLPVSNKN